MSDSDAYLEAIAGELRAGRNQWRRGDKLLAAFGYTRRRQTVIDQINKALDDHGLRSVPPLTTAMPLDRAIRFHLINPSLTMPAIDGGSSPLPADVPAGAGEVVEVAAEDEGTAEAAEPVTVIIAAEPPAIDLEGAGDRALIVGNLECAERPPEWIAPNASVEEALTRMDLRDFSQLVVQTGPRDIKGIISHKSIARAFLHGHPVTVADCIDPGVPRVELQEPLLRVAERLQEHDAVLVNAPDRSLAGIVTAADMAREFGAMAGPFLLIGQIEDQLRWLVRVARLDLRQALLAVGVVGEGDPVPDMEDLTMGELQRILEHADNWQRIGIKYDRATFCKELNTVREIRNAVMHFREPSEPDAFKRVRDLAVVVQRAYLAVTGSH